MRLLERGPFLDDLQGHLAEAAGGAGRMVLIAGEAGIGKTSLISHFCDRNRESAAIAVGACDGLFTPRPLGPLFDLGREFGGELYELVKAGAGREDLLHALLEQLHRSDRPNLLILEDIHWADDATLDLIRLLARRLQGTKTLLIVTFRDDELSAAHPLRVMMGDLVTLRNVSRMSLPHLSVSAVRELIGGASLDADEVLNLTGGNPFYVTEVIATGGEGIPASVIDAVLSRTARLSAEARATLSVAALIGRRVETDLLETIAAPEPGSIEECLGCGVLRAEANRFMFGHELARRAIEGTVSPTSARRIHRLILRALQSRAEHDLARLAHHAEHAGNAGAVVRYAPRAAHNAAAMGAHHEAAEQYRRVLRFGTHLSANERARYLERQSYECYLTNQLQEAVDARKRALDYWRLAGNRLAEGDNLRWLSRLHWYLGENGEAVKAGRLAIDVLEDLPPSRELAMAYSNQSQIHMLGQDLDGTRHWGNKAMDLAGRLGAAEIVVHSLTNIGAAELCAGLDSGRSALLKSLTMARESGYDEHTARALTNLSSVSIQTRHYPRATRYLAEGIPFCTERGLDSQRWYMLSEKTRLLMERGRWPAAEDLAMSVLHNPAVRTPITRISALVTVGLLRARRAEAAEEWLDEALRLASGTGELQRLGPVRAARAEAAWLRGDTVGMLAEASAGYALARTRRDPWSQGMLAYWLLRAGRTPDISEELPEVIRLHLDGRHADAASSWAALGCPYEAAVALAESGDEAGMRRGLAELERLGAVATTRVLRGELRTRGVSGIPRGARKATRSNVLGLTVRETEVLGLLEEGLTNAEIAARLSVSTKTAAHHVSAILRKLAVSSRKAAATKSRTLAIHS